MAVGKFIIFIKLTSKYFSKNIMKHFTEWSKSKEGTVCIIEHTEENHRFFDSVKYRLPYVGELVGEFLVFLKTNRLITIPKIIGAGFNLGAHMLKKSFEYVKTKIHQKPNLLIGL